MLNILYEDPGIVVIDKPSGLLSHSTKIDPDKKNLKDSLQEQIKMKVYPLHRLDKATSGIIILLKEGEKRAKLQATLPYLIEKKTYCALVRGLASSGAIFKYIKDDKENKKSALSYFNTIESFTSVLENKRNKSIKLSLVKVNISYGRQHQIRKHLASIGMPILGDANYGDNALNRSFRITTGEHRRLMLHASELKFMHPIDLKKISIYSSLGEDFKSHLQDLRF